MENDEWQERRTEPVNERDTMKNSRKTNVKSNTSDIEAKEKKEQQEANGKFFSKAMQKEPVANTEEV